MKRRMGRRDRTTAMPDVLFAMLDEDLSFWCPSNEAPGPEASVKRFAAWQLAQSFRKKYLEGIEPEADQRALDKFLSVNQRCKEWNLRLESSWDEELFGTLKRCLYQFFEPKGYPLITSLPQILEEGHCGPGMSIGANGNDFYTKLFSSELSCTSPYLYKAYRNYIWQFPEWSTADTVRREHFGECRVVTGNRVTFVPKRCDISRSICIEPSLNMFYQLGVKNILESRLKKTLGVDLTVQQLKNRELARLGSMDDGPDSFITIDLESASDSMSLRMLEEVLPKSAMAWFMLLRSRTSDLPDGRQIELEMVSTMGNGFTFPLQTILFSCVVAAAYEIHNVPHMCPFGRSLGNWGVNGDDIIVVKKVSRSVLRLLELLGFVVNYGKTFLEGPFRESCGGDYYHGADVRGFYLKSLKTPSSRYAAINGLNLWSAKTGIYLPRTIRYLASTVEYLPVPLWENQDAGIKLPWRLVRSVLPRCRQTGSVLYTRIESVATKLTFDASVARVYVPRGQRGRIYSPSGLLIAILQGCISTTTLRKERFESISVRLDTSKWRAKRAIAPNWEFAHTSADIASAERGRDWEVACLINTGY